MKYYTIDRYGSRFWSVCRDDTTLIAVTVYKKGAVAVVEELLSLQPGWNRARAKEYVRGFIDDHARARRLELKKKRNTERKSKLIKIP